MSFTLSPGAVAAFLAVDEAAAAAEMRAYMRHLELDGDLRVTAEAFADYLGAEFEAAAPPLPQRLDTSAIADALGLSPARAHALVLDRMLHVTDASGPLVPRAAFERFIERNERPPCPPPKPVSIVASTPRPESPPALGTAGSIPNSTGRPSTSACAPETDAQRQRDLRRSNVRAALLRPIAPRTKPKRPVGQMDPHLPEPPTP